MNHRRDIHLDAVDGRAVWPAVEAVDALPTEALPAVALQLAALQARVAARILSHYSIAADVRAPQGTAEEYLSIAHLAKRIPYEEQTIRNLMDAKVLRENEHYFRPRGRIMFWWPAVRAWIEHRVDEPGQEPVPLVRGRRHAG